MAIIYIFNPKTKRVFDLESKGLSRITVKVVGGNVVSGSEKMPEMLGQATASLFSDIEMELPARIKKMQKKLASVCP